MSLNLSDSELDDFIENRLLLKKFVAAVAKVNADINNDVDTQLTFKEKIVYDVVIDCLNTINRMLADINFEENSRAAPDKHGPYRLEWSKHEFAKVATITKVNSDFFWTISVPNEPNNEAVFMHMNTNGTLEDVQTAFNNISTSRS